MRIRFSLPLFLFPLPFLCLSWSGATLAQQNELTPEQQEMLQAIVQEINAECTPPTMPAIPAGDEITEDALLSTQKELKTYIESGNGYLACLESTEESWGSDITDNQKAVVTALYNRTVETLKATADEFNAAVREYKENQAG